MIYLDALPLCYCGARRGLHRYGDECCPNPRWKCGNGEDQWWTHRQEPSTSARRGNDD